MVIASPSTEIKYPDSDGQPMSDNTLQFEWIVTLKCNLEAMYRDDPDVFVAGDLLWYPVEGDNRLRAAPDTMVAFGRQKGYRGSYMQWREDDIPPQVVFEVLSPGNRPGEMVRKFKFYERYGVEEYYIIDPDNLTLDGWTRIDDELVPIEETNGWTSPRLAIRFEVSLDAVQVFRPDGSPFQTFNELTVAQLQEHERAEQFAARAEAEAARAEAASSRAEAEAARAEAEAARADRLAARLKELGESLD